MALELGATLGPVALAYETWGRLAPDGSNAVLVLHAFTGDSHAAGPAGPGHVGSGWWDGIIGSGKPIDTDRFFVVCPNMLGGCQGSTGPSSVAADSRPYGSRFPQVTLRDQVVAECELADHLGIRSWAAVVGGSMGGMRALEWAVCSPERVRRAVLLACGAAATAEQIALCATQAHAIRLDPEFAGGDYYGSPGGGPARGMGVAREIAQIFYRAEQELAVRFDRWAQDGEQPTKGGRFAMESYLDHHAAKLARRFDANTYLVLSRAMDLHDVGRGRGGVAAALTRVSAEATVAGIDSDRLYPLYLQHQLADALPGRPPVQLINSPFGHDGFLLETEQIGKVITGALPS
jgi:homoserine O-acetyltransferase